MSKYRNLLFAVYDLDELQRLGIDIGDLTVRDPYMAAVITRLCMTVSMTATWLDRINQKLNPQEMRMLLGEDAAELSRWLHTFDSELEKEAKSNAAQSSDD